MTVLEGLAAKSIIQFARDQQMDLIVLSSHGQSGLISGTTHKLIFSAPTSVLIIHASQPKEQLYKRILVPLDGSRRAENVLPIVASLARFHKSQVQIVHVVKAPEMARHSPPVQEDIDLSNRWNRNKLTWWCLVRTVIQEIISGPMAAWSIILFYMEKYRCWLCRICL